MPQFKFADLRTLEKALVSDGYVFDFSDRRFREYFHDEFDIDIDSVVYRSDGKSKGKRLMCFLKREPPILVARVLRSLWEYREGQGIALRDGEDALHDAYFAIVRTLEGDAGMVSLKGAIERFERDETLDELVTAIEREINAQKPAVALDRLHTYCMKKFAHLLKQAGTSCDANDPLHSRVGKYLNPLRRGETRPITNAITRAAIDILQQFNQVRNNESLAHDNKLVEPAEARYIFESIVSLLRFIKTLKPKEFGA